jgi:hypothetical protein
MTDTPQTHRQLELPMLSDINSKTKADAPMGVLVTHGKLIANKAHALGATAEDLSVYAQISQNYFRSLKNA